MASREIVQPNARLTIPGPLFRQLMEHLFPGDGDEHGAVVLAGISQTSSGTRLLAREIVLAKDGVDYVTGERGYKMLKAPFILEQIERCEKERLVYLAVHNHGGLHSVAFSATDLRSHERGYPALLDVVDGLPVGALVFARNAIAGDIWNPDGTRVELGAATVLADTRFELSPQTQRLSTHVDERFDRQVRIFGKRGQSILNNTHVAIVGLGGVGSLLVELLARLGVGDFTLVDPDFVETSNLPRLVGARAKDAVPGLLTRALAFLGLKSIKVPKVEYGARLAKQANPEVRVHAHCVDFLKPAAADATLSADYIFLAADSHQARLLFNAIVHQYLIPGAQIGSKITHNKSDGTIIDVFSAYRPLTTFSGCLVCNGLIDSERLLEESLSTEELRNQRYIEGEDVVAPSVMALNAIGAAQAVNRFMTYMTGMNKGSGDYVIHYALASEFEICEPRKNSCCRECGATVASRFAKGKLLELPTKAK